MLSAEELEAEYYKRLIQQMHEQDRRKFFNADRDIDLERVWVAYVWVAADKATPAVGEWKLGGFRRRRNLRRVQTMGRFFAKVRRKLGIDKKSPVMLYDLASALRQTNAPDQSWRFRAPQFQRRKTVMPQITPAIDRRKRKVRAKQRAAIFNPKTTKYIALGRNVLDKRKPGYLYLGPLKSEKKRQAQFEIKRLFPIWSDLLVIATNELSKPLRAALTRNRRVRAGVTRLEWPEVPPTFDKVWGKVVARLVRKEFHDAITADDPGLLDTRDELLKLWEAQKQPWLTPKWFLMQINSWSKTCKTINVAKLLPSKKTRSASRKSRTTGTGTSKRSPTKSSVQRKSVVRYVKVPRRRVVRTTARRVRTVRATLRRG